MANKNLGRRPASSASALHADHGNAVALVLGCAFFLLLCFSSASTIKWTTVLFLIAAIAACVFAAKQLSRHFSLPFLALSLLVLMCGISTAYALSGKFALREFLKLLLAYCVFVLILAFPDRGEDPGRRGASMLSVGTALASLFSIDLLSTRLLSGILLVFLNLFSPDYMDLGGVEEGVRMTSLFTNPNLFAGCAGLGVLLALGLANSAQSRREKNLHLVCLYLNALAFVLVFSMGASGIILVAFLVFLALEDKERRGSLLVLMVETLVFTLCAVFPIFLTSFARWSGFQPVPLLCAAAGSAALCLADRLAGERVSAVLSRHGKATAAMIGVVLCAAGLFAALSLNLTGAATLGAGDTLRRSAYPDGGEYTLSVQSSAAVNVTIETQNESDTMMHTSTVLYSGPAQDAVFTVPDDSMVVYFTFSAPDGARLDSAVISGPGGEEALKLGYKLLPGFIANRMQGLFANQNAIQRTVFFRDGLKLFYRSPIVGLGMGSFENAILGVQSFFYETKYVHNHYIQLLLDTGVIGLALFVATLVLSAAALLLTRRKEGHTPLLAALAAALVFMAGHGAVEIVFSACQYLPIALGVLALICLTCGDALPVPGLSKVSAGLQKLPMRIIALLLALFLLLLGGNLHAHSVAVRGQGGSFQRLQSAIALDKFEWADYMLSYVYNAIQAESPEILEQAKVYAQRLEQVDSNTIPLYLGEFYLATGETQKGLDCLNQYVTYTASKSESWETAFQVLFQHSDTADTELYVQGVRDLYASFLQWNEEHMGTLTLSENTMKLIGIFVSGINS